MNPVWKKAITLKRKYAKQFAKNRRPENWELKRSWRNIATNKRRKAIKTYWRDKADHLQSNPSEFYKTFQPFINNKKIKDLQNYISIHGISEHQ